MRGLRLQVVPQAELGVDAVEETGSTFAENALLKARHAAASTGLPAIADDSGLAVDALDGRPGVRSARYAGANATDASNIDKLLQEMQGLKKDERTAAFHCAAVYVEPASDAVLLAEGRWRGRILDARDGDGGFGYDPVFFDAASGKSAARMTAEEKNAVSHRGQAFRKLVELLHGS